MSTVNGYNIIPLPCPWAWEAMDWSISVPVTDSTSPWTGQTANVLRWPGADGWLITVHTPPLTAAQARVLQAAIWNAQGGANAFMLGDPLNRKPQGTPELAGTLQVNGASAAMASTLNLKGWQPHKNRLLLQGDLISVNSRLYMVLNTEVNSDANGFATVTIGPSLREALTDGMPVLIHDAQGIFRLTKSVVQFSIDQNHMYTTSFAVKEAR